MAQRVSGYERIADDRYETPGHITATIIPFLCSRALRVWEPAHAPADKLGDALRAAGFRVTSTAGDFLQCYDPPDVDALVTNPPYGKQGKLAEAFIAHALDLKVPHVALLLPVDFDSALTRAPLFGDCPTFAGKIVLRRRIKWFPGDSGPSTNHAWYLWDQAHRGLPVLRYATPAKEFCPTKSKRRLDIPNVANQVEKSNAILKENAASAREAAQGVLWVTSDNRQVAFTPERAGGASDETCYPPARGRERGPREEHIWPAKLPGR